MQEVHPHPAIGVAVDVIELPKQYLFVVEVRGLKNTNLKVSLKNNVLLIFVKKVNGNLRTTFLGSFGYFNVYRSESRIVAF